MLNRRHRRYLQQRGFSLVELMVALVLSLIVMAGVVAIFSNTKATSQTDTGLARLQENARFALSIMTAEIRKASYLGCLRDTSAIKSSLNSTDFATNYAVGIQGFEATGTGPTDSISLATVTSGWSPILSTAVPAIPGSAGTVAGSDLMVIRRLSDTGYRLIPPYNDGAQVFVENTASSSFQEGEILVATDCAQAMVFQLTATNAGSTANVTNLAHSAATKTKSGTAIVPGNACPVWGTGCTDPNFGPGSEVAKALTTIFYIRRDNTNVLPALYMASSSSGNLGPGTKLVDGVESMQILYGIDTSAVVELPGVPPIPLWFDRAERYMTAAEVETAGLWQNVVTVRLSLLMRTVNEPGEQADQTVDAKTYALAGTQITPVSDQNRRRVFTSTVQIRNRILPSGN